VAACLASTTGVRSAARITAVPRRTRVVRPAMTESTVSGSSQWPSGPVGWRPPAVPPAFGSP
jgi:hypothetical protein